MGTGVVTNITEGFSIETGSFNSAVYSRLRQVAGPRKSQSCDFPDIGRIQ
jgi:hypothetical protein